VELGLLNRRDPVRITTKGKEGFRRGILILGGPKEKSDGSLVLS
jgi:hypothetical protein